LVDFKTEVSSPGLAACSSFSSDLFLTYKHMVADFLKSFPHSWPKKQACLLMHAFKSPQ
jgi:hypothetical protein